MRFTLYSCVRHASIGDFLLLGVNQFGRFLENYDGARSLSNRRVNEEVAEKFRNIFAGKMCFTMFSLAPSLPTL